MTGVMHNPIDAPSRSLFYFIHDPHVQDVTPGLSRAWWYDRFGNFFGVQWTLPTCPACPADYNLDGGVTGDDIAAFFIAVEQGGC